MRIIAVVLSILLVIFNFNQAFAHGGGLNAQGCHNNTKTGHYHCHKNSGYREQPFQSKSTMTEDFFNMRLAQKLGGRNETTHHYFFGLDGQNQRSSSIRIDVETENFVIEGGKDTRNSLDSIQQAVFASTVTGKKPAVAIYDTDGVWGKYEHRIWTVSKSLNIRFIWFHEGDIVEIQ